MTINDLNSTIKDYDGDGFAFGDEDGNRDGKEDDYGLIGRGSYHAIARFFAFADHNRMPIRRVMMDWGDTQVPLKQMGIYKNRKPVCGEEQCGRSQMTCRSDLECAFLFPISRDDRDCADADGLQFGNSERACKQGYFEFTNTYTCTAAELADEKIGKTIGGIENENVRQRLLEMGIKDGEVCVYRPKAQVMDNWEWCNGSCNDGEGNTGCYGSQCEESENAYTAFQGEIVVIPSSL